MSQEIWNAICDLYSLLKTKSQEESKYQTYFEANPVVFSILGFPKFSSYEKSSGNRLPYDEEQGRQLEPDFICADPQGQNVTVFEIKTPIDGKVTTSLKNGSRCKFKAIIESYISQVAEYCEFIAGNLSARENVAKTLGLGGVKTVVGLLVYGLSNEKEAPHIAKLASRYNPPLSVLTYDKLLEKLLKTYAIGRRDIDLHTTNPLGANFQGFTLVAHVVVSREQKHDRSYLIDIGEVGKNRLSVFIENGVGVVEITDSLSRQFTTEWDCEFNEPIYIRAEISNCSEARFISVFINNRETEYRQGARGADVKFNFSKIVLGGDLEGKNNGCFKLLEASMASATFSWIQRIKSFGLFERKAKKQKECIHFNGRSYLFRGKDGAMIQTKKEFRPTFSENPIF